MADRLDTLSLSINPLQTVLASGFSVPDLIAHLAMPIFRNGGRTFRAPIYGMEAFRTVDDLRALRAKPKQIDFSVTYEDQTLQERALMIPMDYREVEASGVAGIDHVSRARSTVQRAVAINREKRIADLLQTAGTYDTGNSETLATKWDAKTAGVSDADPIADIKDGNEVIRGKIGMRANDFWAGATAWNTIQENTKVMDRMPGGVGSDTRNREVTKERFAQLIGVDNIYIGEAVYSSDGSAFTDIWSDNCGLLYNNPTPNEVESPAFGYSVCRQFGEVDGIPLLGLAGDGQDNEWVSYVWYMEQVLSWVSMDTAGYLWLATNT